MVTPEERIAKLEATAEGMWEELKGMRGEMRDGFRQVDARFNQVDTRFNYVESHVDSRFNQVDTRMTSLENRFWWIAGMMLAMWVTVMLAILFS